MAPDFSDLNNQNPIISSSLRYFEFSAQSPSVLHEHVCRPAVHSDATRTGASVDLISPSLFSLRASESPSIQDTVMALFSKFQLSQPPLRRPEGSVGPIVSDNC